MASGEAEKYGFTTVSNYGFSKLGLCALTRVQNSDMQKDLNRPGINVYSVSENMNIHSYEEVCKVTTIEHPPPPPLILFHPSMSLDNIYIEMIRVCLTEWI